jgi:RecA-family ATPase
LIIIDTLSRINPGEESSNTEMAKFIARIEYIARCTGAAVLLVHHAGKNEDEGGRGASTLRDNTRFVISLSQTKVKGTIKIKHTKINYSYTPDDMFVKLVENGVLLRLDTETSDMVKAADNTTRKVTNSGKNSNGW